MSVSTVAINRKRIPEFVPALLADQMIRNGVFLTMSTGITSVFGIAFWTISAREYSPDVLGRNSAAISAMMFLAGVAEFNLMSALVKFLPVFGKSSGRFVAIVYGVSLCAALAISVVFIMTLGFIAPNLKPLLSTEHLDLWFIGSTMAWTIFVLQDSVLTGLRRTWGVPAENALYSISKVALVVVLARTFTRSGIFVAWTLGLVVSLVLVNTFLVFRAIPAHKRRAVAFEDPPTSHQIVKFVAADYVGALCWLAAVNFLPIIVIDMAGPKANAYYSLDWIIAYSIYLVSGNMGISMVVETASAPSHLAARCRQVTTQTLSVIVPLIAVLSVGAPLLLSMFGRNYASHGTLLLRLLLLSAIPNVITSTAVSASRAQSKTVQSTTMLVCMCVSVFGLSAALIPVLGVTGLGIAWLATETAAAIVFLVVPRLWPRENSETPISDQSLHGRKLFGSTVQRLARRFGSSRRESLRSLEHVLAEVITATGKVEGAPPPPEWTEVEPIPTLSGLSVAAIGPKGAEPIAVLKVAESKLAIDELRSHIAVLERLRADARLGSCAAFLPGIIFSNLQRSPAVVIERRLGTVDGRALLGTPPDAADRLFSDAGDWVSSLHGATSALERVGDRRIEEWVWRPVRSIAALYDPGSWQVGTLDRLSRELDDTLRSCVVDVGWTHGDYTPGNLLMDEPSGRLVGVVDWGGASPSDLGALDPGMLALSIAMLRNKCELGSVIIDIMRSEQQWFDALPMTSAWPGASPRTLALYCWLRHISGNLRKASFYSRRFVWRAANIDAVLKEAYR